MSKAAVAAVIVIVLLIVGGLWFLGVGPFERQRPGFQFRVTDHFGPFDKVEIEFDDILIRHETQGWLEVDLMDDEDDLETVDISDFNSTKGQFHVLEADDDLPFGNYTGIMVELEKVRGVVTLNQTIVQFKLDVDDMVLIVNKNFTINPNKVTIVTVDFDLGLSIVQLGPQNFDFAFVPQVSVKVEQED